MLHDSYEDLNPDYVARIFRARKTLLGSIDHSLLPENGLLARGLLNEVQMDRVKTIRTRRLSHQILKQFVPD
jgi:hypothetical protein